MNSLISEYCELLKSANSYYDLIYDRKNISIEEKEMLERELRSLREVVNDNNWHSQNKLMFNLKKALIVFSNVLLLNLGMPFILTLVLLILEVYKLQKNQAKYAKEEKDSEEIIIKINNILNNLERMSDKKSKTETESEEEVTTTLEDYAKYVFDEYLKTGELITFLDPEFNLAVQIELSILLNHTYGIGLEKDIQTMMCLAKMAIDNGKTAKLTRKMD